MWDSYRSLELNGLGHLMGVHPDPFPDCPVGKNIEIILRKSYAEIENSVKTAMTASRCNS